MGNCRHCGQNAGFLRKQHSQCRDLHATGVQEMTQLAAQAAGSPGFSEVALRQTLRAIAARAHATEDGISQVIADGWAQGVSHAMSDGIITQDEETQLRHFRDRLVSGDDRLVSEGVSTLDQAANGRHDQPGRRCPKPSRIPAGKATAASDPGMGGRRREIHRKATK